MAKFACQAERYSEFKLDSEKKKKLPVDSRITIYHTKLIHRRPHFFQIEWANITLINILHSYAIHLIKCMPFKSQNVPTRTCIWNHIIFLETGSGLENDFNLFSRHMWHKSLFHWLWSPDHCWPPINIFQPASLLPQKVLIFESYKLKRWPLTGNETYSIPC